MAGHGRSGRSPAARSTRPAGSAPRWSATTSPTPGSTSSARSSAPCWRRPSTGSSSSRAAARCRRWRTPSLRAARPARRRGARRCGSRAARAGRRRPRRRRHRGCGASPQPFARLTAMRRVTFSRNYTLSLSRTCQCYCKYCAFATHRAHIHEPDEVERRLDEAVRRNAKELLVLTGERPEVNPEVARRLREWGHEDFTSYVVWACQRGIERGLLPHTNLGVLVARGPGPAARGDRVPGPDARIDEPDRASTRGPRPSTRRGGSRRSGSRASCGSPSPPGSWSASARPRRSGSRPSRRSPRSTRVRAHPGGDPPELRPSSALLRRGGRRDRG